jgi:serine kinase of HPr protein (carbohydrate metabolism regulator)
VPISVQAFRDECTTPLRLRLLAGEGGIRREIAGHRVQEAGLAIAGEVFPDREGCVQILGEIELDYFLRHDPPRQAELAERFFPPRISSGRRTATSTAGTRRPPRFTAFSWR